MEIKNKMTSIEELRNKVKQKKDQEKLGRERMQLEEELEKGTAKGGIKKIIKKGMQGFFGK